MLEIHHAFWILVAVHVVVMFLGPWWTARQLEIKKAIGFVIGCLVGGCLLLILTLMVMEHTRSDGGMGGIIFLYFIAIDLVMAAVGAIFLAGYGIKALVAKHTRVGEAAGGKDAEGPDPS